MNYIIFDLEFNQKNNIPVDSQNNPIEPEINKTHNLLFEIIQIGAIKLDENFKTISTFNQLIKPTIYKSIHPFVENLTKITNEKLAYCKDFVTVYNDFLQFIGSEEMILCVWGYTDIKELIKNMKCYNLSTSYISEYIDIQKYASKYLKAPTKSRIGLKKAIEILNIPIENEFHDAFNDAYYTAEVFKLIYDDNIKPAAYVNAPSKRISKQRDKVDTASLINQFRKIYKREMSEEEISIIKLAYMMGKTRQFIH